MRNTGEASKQRIRDVARHELIGLEVVVTSRHAGWDQLEGRVVDETKNTLVVERTSPGPSGEIVVPKKGQTFAFRDAGVTVIVQGGDITFPPEDRIKRFNR